VPCFYFEHDYSLTCSLVDSGLYVKINIKCYTKENLIKLINAIIYYLKKLKIEIIEAKDEQAGFMRAQSFPISGLISYFEPHGWFFMN